MMTDPTSHLPALLGLMALLPWLGAALVAGLPDAARRLPALLLPLRLQRRARYHIHL